MITGKTIKLGKLGLIYLTTFLTLNACVPKEVPLSTATDAIGTAISGKEAPSSFAGIISADTQSGSKVLIKWNASSDSNTMAYNIYDTSSFFNPKLLRTVLAPATSYSLTGLSTGTLYSFRVKTATATNVEDSNTIDKQAVPYAGVTTVAVNSSTSALLSFADISAADSAGVYCSTNKNATFTLLKSITTVAGVTSTPLTGLSTGITYTCRVNTTVGGFTDNNVQTVTFTPVGQATQLVLTVQPGSAQAGQPLAPQPVLQILDANNNLVSSGPDSTALVTLSLSSQSPTIGTVRGSVAVSAVGGIATFTGINFQEVGAKILTATKQDTSSTPYGSAPLTVDSNQFTIVAGTVSAVNSKLTLTPASTPGNYLIANGSASYTVNFLLEDAYQNPVSGIKPQFNSSDSNDTLNQPTAITDASGMTTGSFSTTVSGLRTLSISSPSGLSTDTVGATFIAGSATKVAFLQQPQNSPAGLATLNSIQVAIQDVQGNTVTTSSAMITLSIYNNVSGANLTGTASVAAINGIATFGGLGIDKTGAYKLVANSAPLSVAYSNNFQILAGTPSKLALTGPASFMSGSCTNALAYTLQLQDAGSINQYISIPT